MQPYGSIFQSIMYLKLPSYDNVFSSLEYSDISENKEILSNFIDFDLIQKLIVHSTIYTNIMSINILLSHCSIPVPNQHKLLCVHGVLCVTRIIIKSG